MLYGNQLINKIKIIYNPYFFALRKTDFLRNLKYLFLKYS